MMINKFAFVLVAGSLLSTAAFAGVHHDRPAPPPPRGELHERVCDGGNCCNLDVRGGSLDYTLRCDHPYGEAQLTIGDRRPETIVLSHNGRLRNAIRPGERLSIRLTPPPPSREIHTRLCDRDNCCNLDVNGRSRDYTLRCDHPIDRAELNVNGRKTINLRDRGHMNQDVFDNDRLSIKLFAPPSREIHTRLCDRDNCCNLDVNGYSRDYTLRCDRPFERAELTVNNRMTFDIRDRGRMSRDVFDGDRLQIRLSYPPPPPPQSHKPARVKAEDDANRRRR
ncbi:MAG: hypothetical protein MJY85_01065 [Fibrobacter sp.]|nr:hypothetical protein [Fibrobacter sp.]